MSCCGKALTVMDYKTLISYDLVKISVIREGHGMKPGVYKVGEGKLSYGKTLALLNDKKAKIIITETYEPSTSDEPTSEEVSTINSEPTGKTKNTKTRGNRNTGRKRSKKIKTGRKRISTDNIVGTEETSTSGIGDIDASGSGGTETQDPWAEESDT